MQDRIYLELKQKEDKVNRLNLQINFNFYNNVDNKNLYIDLDLAIKEVKQFKKDNHLL